MYISLFGDKKLGVRSRIVFPAVQHLINYSMPYETLTLCVAIHFGGNGRAVEIELFSMKGWSEAASDSTRGEKEYLVRIDDESRDIYTRPMYRMLSLYI